MPTSVVVHKERAGLADGSPQHAGNLAPHRVVSVSGRPLAEPVRAAARQSCEESGVSSNNSECRLKLFLCVCVFIEEKN